MEAENFDALVETFSPEVKDAFLTLLRQTLSPPFVWDGTDVCIILCEWGLQRTLRLHDAEGSLGEREIGGPLFWYVSLRQEGERYCLYGEWDETEDPFSITFSGADVDFQPIDCTNQEILFDAPWNLLINAAWAIVSKSKESGAFLNADEQTLLPLANEVTNLFLPSRQETFPLLKALAVSHRLSRMEKLLVGLETCNAKRARRYAQKITSLLCDQRCEPLWRELYGRIRASQAGYPQEAEYNCPADTLAEVREKIQTLMNSHRYEGTYPDFMKTDEKKRTAFRVRYVETVPKTVWLKLQYVSGSGKADETTDIYSCLFRRRGRRYRTGFLFIPFVNVEEKRLAAHVGIAVKLAERKRLTQEENMWRPNGSIAGGWIPLILFALIACGAVPLLICALLALFGAVIALLFGRPDIIPGMFTEFPWWTVLQWIWRALSACISIYFLYTVRKSK